MKTTETDILKEDIRLKEMPFKTPDCYFENIKDKLKVQQTPLTKGTVIHWGRSVAAAVAILLTGGAILLSLQKSNVDFTEEDYLVFSDELSTEVIYSTSTLYAQAYTYTEDDIIEYLLNSDVEVEDFEY